ncbi:Prolyl 4-hydroxylase, alpha subunit [Balamuthia mandrillaris]
MQSSGSSTTTTEIEFSVAKKQDNCPIYQTNGNPITYRPSRKQIRKEEVEGVPGAFLLHNVLSADECQQFIDLTERMGYGDAPISTFGGMRMMPDVRNNQRVMWAAGEETLNPIWERIKEFIPAEEEAMGATWNPYGLNNRFRFYRYDSQQLFNRHYDGCYPRSRNDLSLLTLIIYLNDGVKGGSTTFFPSRNKEVEVTPKQGTALLFWHGPHKLSPEHEGSMVYKGRKYAMRSDVMFRTDFRPPTK